MDSSSNRTDASFDRRTGFAAAADRSETEQLLHYHLLWQTTSDAVVMIDGSGTILFANPAVQTTFGIAPERLVGGNLEQLQPVRLREAHRRGMARYLRSGTRQVDWRATEATGLHHDGHEFPIEITFSDLLVDGRRVFAAGIRDITQRKRAEDDLRASEARFRALTALSSDWYWEQDGALRFTTFTGGRRREGAADLQFMVGATLIECLSDADPQRAPGSVLQRSIAARERFIDVELSVVRPDGAPLVLSVSGEPIAAGDGRCVGYRGLARDLTEVRGAEARHRALAEQLRQAQKMEAIGVLAGGIAHDFNNVLAGILANAALAKTDAGTDAAAGSLEGIERAGRRGRALVRQILSFAQRQPHEPALLPLRPIVEETLSLLKVALPPGGAIETDLGDEPLLVRVDAAQIGQVLMNLGTNAWHAAKGRGRIRVRLAHHTLPGPLAVATGMLAAGRYAALSVSDSGVGMSAETQKRIFEPFFTTKPAGEGTGLGLSVVHGLVLGHGGGIAVHSEVGIGSTFTVYLPLAEGAARADDAGAPVLRQPLPAGANERILYIDDDEVLVLVIDRLLQRQGYRVHACQDAAQALQLVASRPHDFDLVLTDYSMPEHSGLDIVRAVRDVRPDLPVVMTSGNLTPELLAQAAALGVKAVIGKEDCVDELGAALHRVLSAGRAA